MRYDGLQLAISADPQASKFSPETFTLILKNTIRSKQPKEPKLPPQPEPAVITYEAPFKRPSSADSHSQGHDSIAKRIDIEWSQFKPHYRGREIPRDDERWRPLDTEGIYELSFMCRSGFGKQQGDFGVIIEGVSGLEKKGSGLMGLGSRGDLTTWLSSWWAWISSFFLGGGRVRLDDSV